jgi:predicted ATPase
MKIKSVHIENFRGVRRATLENLNELVVIAGQNGSGKSCLLDGIRLIKSVYGGYQPNEYHQWFGEFQINFNHDRRAFTGLFNDSSKPLALQIEIELHSDERAFLKENAQRLVHQQAWKAVVPELMGWRNLDAAPLTTHYRMRESEVQQIAKNDMGLFGGQIDASTITARIDIAPGNLPQFTPSKVLELAFSEYEPDHIGIIDYHGPHRLFAREQLSAINVNLDAIEQQRRQSALYNYNAKYSNVKSEMAGLYVREALAEKAGVKFGGEGTLTQTLKELFSTFFPEKEFLGPQPTADGSLRFPVKVGGKETHDLDELSSGEKEILYGYLRLRSSAPKLSVILLDEPELHLNPRLTRNLPEFYHRHLAQELGNQVWLITHSDAILRESVGRRGASVFHMTASAYAEQGHNQARMVQADHDLERAIIDLVGDLAAYNPGAKVVIFEGEDSDFDVFMTSNLFPELAAKVNLVSGTNKARVRGLHGLLERLQEGAKLPPMRIYSITDKDSDTSEPIATTRFTWDRYHIENYLIEPEFVRRALQDVQGQRALQTVEEIERQLIACARDTITSLVVHQVCLTANRKLVSAISTKIDPKSSRISADLTRALEASVERIAELKKGHLSQEILETEIHDIEAQFETDFANGNWRKTVRGRDVLKLFVSRHVNGMNYEAFRNLIVSRMRDDSFQPGGMKQILDTILAPTPLARD